MEKLLEQRDRLRIGHCYNAFEKLITETRAFLDQAKGNFRRFKDVVDRIPDVVPARIDLDAKAVTAGNASELSDSRHRQINEGLAQLCPWRKGPFNLFGIEVDSEWQSWMKWDRLRPHIGSLKGRRILDIGSSNGYYMFRMAAHEPLMILGLEPQSSFYYQYLAVQKFLRLDNVFCLPIPHDRLPAMDRYFDMVFCMGVLYHRKSPIQMLKEICDAMRPGGMLVLENLIIESEQGLCLFPEDRYAKMRNVYFIPDLAAMTSWLLRAGFTDIHCVDVTRTTSDEQRKTAWIQTESLADFLDPHDPSLTVEGYPAPVRAIFTARAT